MMAAVRGLKVIDYGSRARRDQITAHIDGPDWAAWEEEEEDEEEEKD